MTAGSGFMPNAGLYKSDTETDVAQELKPTMTTIVAAHT
jgi:hypothetical protein